MRIVMKKRVHSSRFYFSIQLLFLTISLVTTVQYQVYGRVIPTKAHLFANMPTVFNVTGGGTYCAGSPGLDVGLDGSEAGVVYTLIKNNTPTLLTLQGTGQPLSFGLQTAAQYTISAFNGSKSALMNGQAIITEQPLPVVNIKASQNYICSGSVATYYADISQAPNPVYQWYKNYSPVGTNSNSYTYTPTHNDVIQLSVTSGNCTGLSDIYQVITYPVTAGISISCETNQIVAGQSVTYAATLYNGGNKYQLKWYVNGDLVNEGSMEYTFIPENMDEIYATLAIGDDVPCLQEYFLTSNAIVMSVCDSGPQTFTIISEDSYICGSDFGILMLDESEPGVAYTVYHKYNGSFIPYPFCTPKPGTGSSIEFEVSGGEFKINATNACSTSWMNGICIFKIIDDSSPVMASDNDILAGTAVTFSVPLLDANIPPPVYRWNKNNDGNYFTGETFTFIPENGDFIQASMITPCTNYDVNNTVVMFVREAGAHYTNWTGNHSNDWHNPLNWDNGIPGVTSIVTIPETAVHYPTLSSAASCASLIMHNSASFIGAENLNVKSVKLSRDNTANQFQFISSPLSNSTTWGNVFPSNQNSIWIREYWEGSGEWLNHSIRNIISNNKGYSYKGLQPGQATFIGWLTLNEPEAFINYNNISNDIDRDGWNLMGNPYSSSIDWDLILGNDTEAAVYVWNGFNYISWNGTVGALNHGIIPPMTGFFVKALYKGYSPFQIPKTARVHANDVFHKQSAIGPILEVEVSDGTYEDKTYFRINNEATHNFDSGHDARKLFGIDEAPQLYSETRGLALSINEFPWQGTEIEHHLCFGAGKFGEYILNFSASGFGPEQKVTFTDNQKQISFALDNQYQYKFDYLPGENPQRFFIKISPGAYTPSNLRLQAYAHGGSIHVLNPNLENGEMRIISTNAQVVYTSRIAGSDHQEFSPSLGNGVYIVQIITNNATYNEKIIF